MGKINLYPSLYLSPYPGPYPGLYPTLYLDLYLGLGGGSNLVFTTLSDDHLTLFE